MGREGVASDRPSRNGEAKHCPSDCAAKIATESFPQHAPTMNLNYSLLQAIATLLLSSNVVMSEPTYVELKGNPVENGFARETALDETTRFAEWCDRRRSLSKATRRTVDALIERSGVSVGSRIREEQCLHIERALMEKTSLNLVSDEAITDLRPLASLTQLSKLTLYCSKEDGAFLEDPTPISHLRNLTELTLNDCRLNDLSFVKTLTSLTVLNVSNIFGYSNAKIDDLSPLENLTNLRELFLRGSEIDSLSSFPDLPNLKILGLLHNQISDLAPLANSTRLKRLVLEGNQIGELGPLANLTELRALKLRENQIADLSPLANLTHLLVLDVRQNEIRDVTPLSNLTQLERLRLSDNPIEDLSPLHAFENLTHLNVPAGASCPETLRSRFRACRHDAIPNRQQSEKLPKSEGDV